jgi:3',5'-cyclic-nucleotide phosphodiesterase
MEHGACNIVYLDRRASEETVRKDSVMSREEVKQPEYSGPEYFKLELREPQHTNEITNNIESILSTFNEGNSLTFHPKIGTSLM